MSALNMKQLKAGYQEAHRHTQYEMRTSATWFPKMADKNRKNYEVPE